MATIPLLVSYRVYTSRESGEYSIDSPPSPQFWGSQSLESPPELGDLGGN